MSYPPPPSGHNPNPYAANPQGVPPQQPPGYGYAQQPGGQPAYPGPQGQPGYPGYPAYPGGPGGGMVPPNASMPGITVAARVLLFIAGGLWTLSALAVLSFAALGGRRVAIDETTVGFIWLVGVIGLVMAVLHIVSASLFGKGRRGTRVTAIVAAGLNTAVPVLGFIGSMADTEAMRDFNPGQALVWTAFGACSLAFCLVSPTRHWFNRERF